MGLHLQAGTAYPLEQHHCTVAVELLRQQHTLPGMPSAATSAAELSQGTDCLLQSQGATGNAGSISSSIGGVATEAAALAGHCVDETASVLSGFSMQRQRAVQQVGPKHAVKEHACLPAGACLMLHAW